MSSKLSERLRVIQLRAPGVTAIDVVGTGVAAGAPGPHRAMAIVTVSAVGGDADETYDLTIQGSNTAIDSGFESAHAPGEPTVMAFTQPNGAQVAKVGLKPFKWYRENMDVANTTPSITYGVNVVLEPSKLPAAAQAAS
jgi:hypothetical protein